MAVESFQKLKNNYNITEKECLACVATYKDYHYYLIRSKIYMILQDMDYSTLKWLMNQSE